MSERDMHRLLRVVADHLGSEWVDLSDWLRSLPDNELLEIERRIASGMWSQLIVGVDDAALRFAAETHGQYVLAGETAAKWLDGKLDERLVRFDIANERAVHRAQTNQLEHVYGFREEQNQIAQQIAHRAMVEGAQGGINPRRVAQDFRDSIGLAPVQEKWVANYRRALEEGRYGDAMGRQLHDGRSDRMLQRLGRVNEALSPAQVDKLVEGYRTRMLGYRAETIARTEASSNVHEGMRDGFIQAIERGDIDAALLLKEWHARNPGPDAREQHQAMDGTAVAFNVDFVMPDGTRMAHPGDRRGGAKHNASCGCTTSHTLGA